MHRSPLLKIRRWCHAPLQGRDRPPFSRSARRSIHSSFQRPPAFSYVGDGKVSSASSDRAGSAAPPRAGSSLPGGKGEGLHHQTQGGDRSWMMGRRRPRKVTLSYIVHHIPAVLPRQHIAGPDQGRKHKRSILHQHRTVRNGSSRSSIGNHNKPTHLSPLRFQAYRAPQLPPQPLHSRAASLAVVDDRP